MSNVQYFNHITMKALLLESSELSSFLPLECNSGVLLLRDCTRERGKNQSKTIVNSYHADFTFNEILDSLENRILNNCGDFIIKNEQAEAPQINASFSTTDERDEWLKNTFKLIETNET